MGIRDTYSCIQLYLDDYKLILFSTGIKLSDLPDEPVFATQLNEQDYPDVKSGGAKTKGEYN